jgi:hypothetical protein
MHAETGDDEERCEIRQQAKSEEPQIDLLSWADRQPIDDLRCCSGCVVGQGLSQVPWWFQGGHLASLPWAVLTATHNLTIDCRGFVH